MHVRELYLYFFQIFVIGFHVPHAGFHDPMGIKSVRG